MKYLLSLLIALSLFSSIAFALGPVPVNLWVGGAGGSFGIGMNVGMDIGVTLPMLPPLIIEAESSGMILPLVLVNAATASQRIGLVSRTGLVGDWLKFKLSAGAAMISSDTAFIWSGDTINKTNSCAYISMGPEISFLGIGGYAKLVLMNLPQATAGEVDFGLLSSF